MSRYKTQDKINNLFICDNCGNPIALPIEPVLKDTSVFNTHGGKS